MFGITHYCLGNGLSGMMIVAHTLALEVRYEWRVEPHPIKKKRKG